MLNTPASEWGKMISTRKPPPPALTVKLDNNRNLLISNSGPHSKFDVDVTRIDSNGKKVTIQLNDLGAKDEGKDSFEIEIGKWDGGTSIPVKHDAEGNGFDDNKAEPIKNKKNDINDDDEKPEGVEQSFLVNDGYFSSFWTWILG
jgi:hypothetical protein